MARQSKRGVLQEQAIASLLRTGSIATTAAELGLSERTIRRWMADSAFMADYHAARRAAYDATVSRLQSLSLRAVETLESALSDPNTRNRIAAARLILTATGQGVELLDLAQRLEKLEDV